MVLIDNDSASGLPARFPDRVINEQPYRYSFVWNALPLMDVWKQGYPLLWDYLQVLLPVLELYANLDASNLFFHRLATNAHDAENPDLRIRLFVPFLQAPGSTLSSYLELNPQKLTGLPNSADNKTVHLVICTLLLAIHDVYHWQGLPPPTLVMEEQNPYWHLARQVRDESKAGRVLSEWLAKKPQSCRVWQTEVFVGLAPGHMNYVLDAWTWLLHEERLGKQEAEPVDFTQVDTLGLVVHPRFGHVRHALENHPLLALNGPSGSGKSTLARQVLTSFNVPLLVLPCAAIGLDGSFLSCLLNYDGLLAQQVVNLYREGGSLLLEYPESGYNSYYESLVRLLAEPFLLVPGLGTKGQLTRHEQFRLVVTASEYGRNRAGDYGAFAGACLYIEHSDVLMNAVLPDVNFRLALDHLRRYLSERQNDRVRYEVLGVSRYAAAARLLLSGLNPQQAFDQLFDHELHTYQHFDKDVLARSRELLAKSSKLTQKGVARKKRRAATDVRVQAELAHSSPEAQQQFAQKLLTNARLAPAPPVPSAEPAIPANIQEAEGGYVDTDTSEFYPSLAAALAATSTPTSVSA